MAVRSSSLSTQTLCPRMGVFVLAEQPLLAYMSVDLRGLQAGMSEKFLDDPDVGSPVEEMGGEGVAQGVGVGGRRGAVVEDAPDVPGPEPVAPQIEEYGVRGRMRPLEPAAPVIQISLHSLDRRRA